MTDNHEWGAGKAKSYAQKGPGFRKKEFRAHATIFLEGLPGDAAYLINSGKIEIRKGINTPNPQKLAELSRGDVFGEMALFDDRARMASAIALTDVNLTCLSREEFLRRLDSVDPVMKSMMLTMVLRTRKMADEFLRRRVERSWGDWKEV